MIALSTIIPTLSVISLISSDKPLLTTGAHRCEFSTHLSSMTNMRIFPLANSPEGDIISVGISHRFPKPCLYTLTHWACTLCCTLAWRSNHHSVVSLVCFATDCDCLKRYVSTLQYYVLSTFTPFECSNLIRDRQLQYLLITWYEASLFTFFLPANPNGSPF